ncbi:hypothetical protein BWI17_17905 [Betaproteobacteria bacterium GR16-43]|nr:hypothetical protein BWI17_17905 [Betaproteobacteria bacterium GR16-43]
MVETLAFAGFVAMTLLMTVGLLVASMLHERAKELRAANSRLAQSEARLVGFIISAHDAILSIDDRGLVRLFNPAAERLFGWSVRELAGTSAERLVPERHRESYRERLRGYLGDGMPRIQVELTCLRADGSEVPVEVSLSRHDVAGRPVLTLVARDITGRRIAQEQSQRMNDELERRVATRTSELTRTVGELESFCYTVSHDLRAPLRAIDGFAQVLVQDHGPGLDGEAQRLLDRVSGNARQMAALIDGLLELSRLGRGDLKCRPVDLARVAAEQAAIASHGHPSARIEVDSMPPAVGDERLLAQVLANLLSNAVKFSSRNEEPLVRVGAWEESGRIVYYVSDNGVGFDMRHASKLFGVFERLHGPKEFPGTGVGLATVQRIVERHGGQVWAESEPGRGARFSFTLDVAPQQ